MAGNRTVFNHGEKIGVYAVEGARASCSGELKAKELERGSTLPGDCIDGDIGDPRRPRPRRPYSIPAFRDDLPVQDSYGAMPISGTVSCAGDLDTGAAFVTANAL